MSHEFRSAVLLILAALILTPAYSTTITTYSSQSSWQGVTSGSQTVNFEGMTPPNTSTYYNGSTGVTADGVQFIGYTSTGATSVQVIDTNVSQYYNYGTNDALMQDMDRPNSSSPLPYIQIVLPAGVTSLSFDLFSVSPDALSATITVNGTQYTVAANSRPNLAFWGITSTTPITSLTITLNGTSFNGSSHLLIDNFSFGTLDGTDAPEASTYLLIGSGLVGLVALRKRLAVRDV
jgi:hypothetical protein